MIKPIFELNGTEINPPINWEALSVELNFDKDSPNFAGQVAVTQWDIGLGSKNDPRDGARIIQNYINSGLTGGAGVFEGLPFNIKLKEGSTIHDLFQGYLDISEAEVTCSQITAKATETGRIDWLNTVADSFTFEYLFDQNGLSEEEVRLYTNGLSKISYNDFIKVPYVLSSIPDTQQLFTLTLSAFVITQELIETYQEWQEISLPFAGDYLEFGQIIALVALTIKNVLLIIALIKLIDEILDVTIQPIKYHAGMFLYDLCEFGAKYLGFDEFRSATILERHPYNKWVALPESYRLFENDGGGSPINSIKNSFIGQFRDNIDNSKGFFKGTFGDLLRELKILFNAKLVIDGNILRLERVDYQISANKFQLPDVDRRNIPYKFNHEDFAAHYNLSFTPDLNDKNVWQNYLGTEIQVITTPNFYRDKRNIITKGEKLLKTRFALSRRKNSLTFVERYIKELVSDIDKIIGFAETAINDTLRPTNKLVKAAKKIIKQLNTVPPPLVGNILPSFNPPILKPFKFDWRLSDVININKRFGALLLENDFINVPKLVMLNVSDKNTQQQYVKLHVDNDTLVSATYIYDDLHFINSFVGNNPNQYKIYSLTDIEFCIDDYLLVKNNSLILDSDGITEGEVISVKWNIFTQKADITYKVREKYTNNLKESKIVSDGR